MKTKNICKFIIFVLFLSSCSTYSKMLKLDKNTKPLNIQYPVMRTVVYNNSRAYEFKNDKSDTLAIIIEGMGFFSVLGWEEGDYFQKYGYWFYVLEEFKDECSILVLEKLNFELGKYYGYDVETRKNYTIENLVKSYSFIIDSYLSENSYAKVVLFGFSEGACILPLVYKNTQNKNKFSGMASMSYGGLSRYEQMKIMADSQLNYSKIDREIFKNIDIFKEDINLYPNSIGDFAGYPYPLWNSLFDYRPFDDYKDIDIPVLFIHGEMDMNVPVESTKYIQDNLHGKPFEYLIYSDANHYSFMNSKETYNDFRNKSREWLNKL